MVNYLNQLTGFVDTATASTNRKVTFAVRNVSKVTNGNTNKIFIHKIGNRKLNSYKMAINATSTGGAPRELIPQGNYIARCYKMIEIGTVDEIILGEKKTMHKVRIGWELPTEMRVFDKEKGEQPLVIDKEYTLSMHEKSALRKDLKSWRGKDFTEEQAKSFDITQLIGVPCVINIGHKAGKKDPNKFYEEISAVTPLPKGVSCPDAINRTFVLSYDNFDKELFAMLPDFIKNKMVTSVEYKGMQNPQSTTVTPEEESDLPF